MTNDETARLRAQCSAIIEVGRSLHDQATAGEYVVQPSDVLAVGDAVDDAMALKGAAEAAGLGLAWAHMVAASHALHYELGQRTREPEAMTEGSEFIRLVKAMIVAAEDALQALP